MIKIKCFIKNCFSRFNSCLKSNFTRFKKWFRCYQKNIAKFVALFIFCCMLFSFGTCYGVVNYDRFNSFSCVEFAEPSASVSSNGSGLLPPKENGVQYSYHSIVNFGNLLTARNSTVVDSSCENLLFTTLADYSNPNTVLIDSFFDVYSSSRGASDINGTTRLLLETYRFRKTASYSTSDRGIVNEYRPKASEISDNWFIAFFTNVDSTTLGCVNSFVYDCYFEFYDGLTCSSLSTVTRIDHSLYYSTRYDNCCVSTYKIYTDKIHDSYPLNVGDYSLIGAFQIWIHGTGDLTGASSSIGLNSYSYEPLFSANFYSLLNNSYDLGYSFGKQDGIDETTDYYENVVIPSIENGSYNDGKLAGIEVGKAEMRAYYENSVIPKLKKEQYDYGYADGLKDGAKNPTIVVFDAITSGVNSLLHINILPNFTILHFSLIIFSFVMFFMLLHRLQK